MTDTNAIGSATAQITSGAPQAEEPEDGEFAPYKVHKYAKKYPLPNARQFREIVEDIRRRGLRRPIVTTYDGECIIDGRVRFLACKEAGVAPRFIKLHANHTDEMIWEYVWSANLYRRHMTSDQRAVLAATYAQEIEPQAKARQRFHGGTAPGRSRTLPPPNGRSVPDNPRARETTRIAAERHGVSKDKTQQAITLRKKAPELFKQVENGNIELCEAWRTYQQHFVSGAASGARPAAVTEPTDHQNDTQLVRNAAAELKHVFDVFTSTRVCLLLLSMPERQRVLAQAEGIAEIARRSVTSRFPEQLPEEK